MHIIFFSSPEMRTSHHPPYTYLGALFQIFSIKDLGSKWMRGVWSSLLPLSPLCISCSLSLLSFVSFSPHFHPLSLPLPSPLLIFFPSSLFFFSSHLPSPCFLFFFFLLWEVVWILESKTTAEPLQFGTIQLREKYKRKIVWLRNQGQNLFE